MIDIGQVEEVIFQYMIKNGHSPKYVLIDRNSYEEFNQMATPKEKITTPEPEKGNRVASIQSIHSTKMIEIISVNTDRVLLEAVS